MRLADLFPGSAHVYSLNLDRADDTIVWECARDHGFLLVTKDADFGELSMLHGFPPKVIWLRLGNCLTADIEHLLRLRFDAIQQLVESDTIGILTLR